MKYEEHPVAALFPMMAEDELADLAADIAANGLEQPIVLDSQGRILDGRNRLAACKRAGAEPAFVTYEGDDPDEYALRVNVYRRHLRPGQRYLVMEMARRAAGGKVGKTTIAESDHIRQQLSAAAVVLDYRPDLVPLVLGTGIDLLSLSGAADIARERKAELRERERQLDLLRKEAPDLAARVDDDDMPLHEAIGAYEARKAAAEREERERAQTEAARIAALMESGDEWYTPGWLFEGLGFQPGGLEFWADVCAAPEEVRAQAPVPAERYFTAADDGLALPWDGTVWCNPPYSAPEAWARRMIHHGDGLLLTHVPMNAAWAIDVWEACDGLRLFQGMEFTRPDGTKDRPGYWLMLAAFGETATKALYRWQPLGDGARNRRRLASPMWRRAAP